MTELRQTQHLSWFIKRDEFPVDVTGFSPLEGKQVSGGDTTIARVLTVFLSM